MMLEPGNRILAYRKVVHHLICPSTACKVKNLFKLAVLPLVLVMIIILAPCAGSYLYYGSDSRTIYVAQPIKPEDLVRVGKLLPRAIFFVEGADTGLFSDPSLFSHLTEVTFRFDDPAQAEKLDQFTKSADTYPFTQLKHNSFLPGDFDRVLSDLAKNYSRISSLFIYRKKSLSERQLETMRKFRNLKSLIISAPLDIDMSLADHLPNDLVHLGLEHLAVSQEKLRLGKLCRLKDLSVTDCELGSDFCKNLQLPQLKKITISDAKVDPHCFDTTQTLPSLTEICLSNSPITDSAIQRWSHNANVRVEAGWESKLYPKAKR
jgi:hypothetical protein